MRDNFSVKIVKSTISLPIKLTRLLEVPDALYSDSSSLPISNLLGIIKKQRPRKKPRKLIAPIKCDHTLTLSL